MVNMLFISQKISKKIIIFAINGMFLSEKINRRNLIKDS